MELRELLATVASTSVSDWQILFRPTFRYRIIEIRNDDGEIERLDADEHLVAFSYRPDVSITMAYGLVDQGAFELPQGHPFATENARSSYLDIYLEGRLAHREVILSVDRQRCLLPMPRDWDSPIKVAVAQYSLVRLIHNLAGPPTDYDSYFKQADMIRADIPWP